MYTTSNCEFNVDLVAHGISRIQSKEKETQRIVKFKEWKVSHVSLMFASCRIINIQYSVENKIKKDGYAYNNATKL